jgi:hypothetical protein
MKHDWTKPAEGSHCDICHKFGAPHRKCEADRKRWASLFGRPPEDGKTARHGYPTARRRAKSRGVCDAGLAGEDEAGVPGSGMTRQRGQRQ